MRIDLYSLDHIDKAVIVSFVGMWNPPEVKKFTETIRQMKPRYLIVDPTDMIVPEDISRQVSASSLERQAGLKILSDLMREDKMLYILINSNDSPAFATTKQHFIDTDVIEQFVSVQTKEEALKLVMELESEN